MNTNLDPEGWMWSRSLNRPVLVVRVDKLWDSTSALVMDSDSSVCRLIGSDLRPLDAIEAIHTSKVEIIRVAAGCRLDHHLNLPDTLTAHISTDIEILPHQIQHLSDILGQGMTRILLADEVGLGKTITAGLVLSELKNRGLSNRVLIVSPAGIVPQWIQEMKGHFGMDFTPLFTDLQPTPNTGSVWGRYDHVVTSYDAIKPVTTRRGWTKARIDSHNSNRFESLLDSEWDFVIMDEAHRVAGAQVGVARNMLAKGLSASVPKVMLLTGTPHQGKDDQFLRLMQILDSDTFSTLETVNSQNLAKYVLRTQKSDAVTMEGDSLFVKRTTMLMVIPDNERSVLHRQLYEETAEYIRTGYEAARAPSRKGIGFLMVLMQRLLASSTVALESSMRKRLSAIEGNVPGEGCLDYSDFVDIDTDVHEESIEVYTFDETYEIQEIKTLLSLAESCRLEGHDPKAKFLVSLLRQILQTERDPLAKILIFTEFQATQQMLATYLSDNGYSVTMLNGSMGIEERVTAQKDFAAGAQIMISTEAGGEGLNLQFSHIVVNYDLPWNPMRIEQRTGRVHRIGQRHPVVVYNLVLDGTIEHRVIEVLGSKLEQIMRQLGIDKLSDLIDTSDIDDEIRAIYRDALKCDKAALESEISMLVANIKERAERIRREVRSIEKPLDIKEIAKRLSEPVEYWLQRFAVTSSSALLNDMRDGATRKAIASLPVWSKVTLVPKLMMPQLPSEVRGTWSLWRVSVRDGLGNRMIRYRPILAAETGSLLGPSALMVFDELIAGGFEIEGYLDATETAGEYYASLKIAEEDCRSTYESMMRFLVERRGDEGQKHARSISARRNSILAVGLPEVRAHRLAKLRDEDEEWMRARLKALDYTPSLDPVMIVKVCGGHE